MEKARRRHVPAFGEWNYCTSSSSSSPHDLPLPHSGAAECWWYAPQPEPEACSDAWFRYSPPPRRRPPAPARSKKPRRPETAGGRGEQKGVATETTARARAVRAPARGAGRRVVVVRPVDEDLYRVPPAPDNDGDTVSRLPRRRKRAARRSLWMGCLGLNCVA